MKIDQQAAQKTGSKRLKAQPRQSIKVDSLSTQLRYEDTRLFSEYTCATVLVLNRGASIGKCRRVSDLGRKVAAE